MKITEIITGISNYIHTSIYITPNIKVYKRNASATDTIHSLSFSNRLYDLCFRRRRGKKVCLLCRLFFGIIITIIIINITTSSSSRV